MELDSEMIIIEVEKYPELYDPNNENYKCRNAKLEAWKKVTEVVVGETYKNMIEKEKNEIEKDVHKKWKALKDAYFRSLRMQEKRKPGRQRRPYIFHKQLSFTAPLYDKIQVSGNVEDLNDEIENTTSPSISGVSTTKRKKKKINVSHQNNNPDNQIVMPIISNQHEDNDPDLLYLLTLLPRMKQLRETNKFDFQIKVMQLLQQYLEM